MVPQAVGNDVCCGMRLLATDVEKSELLPHVAALKQRLRAIFFQGQRDIPVTFLGTTVRPGEWIYADADGVLVSARALT